MSAWEIAATIIVPLLGIVSGLLGAKWRKGLTLLKETSEAVVALGVCGLSMHHALEEPTTTPEQRREITQAFENVGREFSEAIAAARDLASR
ncbi:MAG: hypothetical protein SVP26_08770 [Chloroflexota bacterium]|nr:hypothetical protein [Chloroflexota bacterium]